MAFYPSEFSKAVLAAGDVRIPGFQNPGRSPRINGLVERFESIFQSMAPSLAAVFEGHMHVLADLLLAHGSNGSWIANYLGEVLDDLEDAGRQVEDHPRAALIEALMKLNATEVAVLEEAIAREVVVMYAVSDGASKSHIALENG